MNKNYVVTEYWMMNGEGGAQAHVFSTYEKAKGFYQHCIEKELQDGFASNSFDNGDIEFIINDSHEGNLEGCYIIEEVFDIEYPESDLFWSWYEKGYYADCHSDYKLEVLDVDDSLREID